MIPNPVFNGGRTKTIAEWGHDAHRRVRADPYRRGRSHRAPRRARGVERRGRRVPGRAPSQHAEDPMIPLCSSMWPSPPPAFDPATPAQPLRRRRDVHPGRHHEAVEFRGALPGPERDAVRPPARSTRRRSGRTRLLLARGSPRRSGRRRPDSGCSCCTWAPRTSVAHGTPIVFVPGAGDNASRGFITLATHEDDREAAGVRDHLRAPARRRVRARRADRRRDRGDQAADRRRAGRRGRAQQGRHRGHDLHVQPRRHRLGPTTPLRRRRDPLPRRRAQAGAHRHAARRHRHRLPLAGRELRGARPRIPRWRRCRGAPTARWGR